MTRDNDNEEDIVSEERDELPEREELAEVAYRAWCDARRGGTMDTAEYEAIRSRVEFEWAHNVVDAVLAALSTQPAVSVVEDARAEAHRRYEPSKLIEDYDGDRYVDDDWGYDECQRSAFIEGAVWQASRNANENGENTHE